MSAARLTKNTQREHCFAQFVPPQVCGAVLLCCLVVVLSSCTNPFFVPAHSGASQTPAPVDSPTPAATRSATPTPVPPVINLQVVNCPSLSINWDSLVGTKAHLDKVQKVLCGSLEGTGSLDALVNVRYYSPDARLDFYVYDNLSGTPIRRWGEQGLLDGDAQISSSGTIMTAEIGVGDPVKSVPDVFKEFQWSGATFSQILFPGMFPDMTRYQAEQDQAVVSQNEALPTPITSWKTSFDAVVSNLASKIFHWGNISITTLAYQPSSGTYIAQVNNLGPGAGGFVADLFRLDNITTNIFEVDKVTASDGVTLLSSPAPGASLTSPTSVSGAATASGNVLGQILVYDDTFVIVGDSGAISSSVSAGYVNFTRSVDYHLNARGVQEGALAFFFTNQNNTALSNQVVMAKVFLTA